MGAQSEVYYYPEGGVAYSSAAKSKITFTAAAAGAPSVTAPEAPKLVQDNSNSKGKIAIWGEDNQFPQMIIEEVEKNVQSSALIYWKTNALVSGGLVYGTRKYDPKTGEEFLVPVRDPEVEKWLKTSNISTYLSESAHEFHKFFNAWARMIPSVDGSRIASISCMESSWCRWGVQNNKGLSDNVYVHTNWAKNPSEDDENMMLIPAIDPYYDPVGQYAKNLTKYKKKGFLFPIAGTSSGKAYYQLHPWDSARRAGWLSQANFIPQYKNSLMLQQLGAYWHIEIPDWWWEWKFPDWKKKPELQASRQKAVVDDFNNKMAGVEAAGKTLMTIIKTDDKNREFSGWKIHRIGHDEKKGGVLIEDGQEASANIAFAHGVDYTLIGPAPGKGMGGGSGSDKRVAYNIYITISKPEQDIILKPIEFAFEVNKFINPETKEPYDIWFRNYWVTTLDKGKETQQQAS